MIILAIALAAVAFVLSASAGFGGSLLLVPALSLVLGPKEGIALAALLLACNNVAKLVVYRKAVPLKRAGLVVALTILGSAVGAALLLEVPESVVGAGVIVVTVLAFAAESLGISRFGNLSSAALALLSGATSGFSGTSGPLKGLALRTLRLDRLHLVGAASAVSFAGDVTKSLVFASGALLSETSYMILVGAIPVMPVAALLGRRLNTRLGERAYAMMFWTVMAGYSVRLVLR